MLKPPSLETFLMSLAATLVSMSPLSELIGRFI